MKHWILASLLLIITAKSTESQSTSAATHLPRFTTANDSVRTVLFDSITHTIYSQWEGTPWSFFGQTETPQKGSIACGYFVTIVLSQAGFNIPAKKWATVPSETFIRSFTSEVYSFKEKTPQEVFQSLQKNASDSSSKRLYIAGLDNHVGFLLYEHNKWWFMHSNYIEEKGVEKVLAATQPAFKKSHYRFIGRILSDRMLQKWIDGIEWKP